MVSLLKGGAVVVGGRCGGYRVDLATLSFFLLLGDNTLSHLNQWSGGVVVSVHGEKLVSESLLSVVTSE